MSLPGGGLTQQQADALYSPIGALTEAAADGLYSPIGALTEAEADMLYSAIGALTEVEADTLYSPIGALTEAAADLIYQPIGDYLDEAAGDLLYSPIGALTEATADTLYSPIGALTEATADTLYAPITGIIGPTVSLGNQSITASTPTLITGSLISTPPLGLLAGTTIMWDFVLHKTSAGIASSTFEVRAGASGTVSDAVVMSFTTVASTASTDTALFRLQWTVVAPGAATTQLGTLRVGPKSATATNGWLNRPGEVILGTPTVFDVSGVDFIHVAATTGADTVGTCRSCVTRVIQPKNP